MRLTDRVLAFSPVLAVAGAIGLSLVSPAAPLVLVLVTALLFVALFVVAERRLRDVMPTEKHGRMARWRHPSRNPLARLIDGVASSRVISAWLEPLPIVTMVSDIEDVVYVNYLVPAERLAPYLPWGLELSRLGPDGKYALFSFLTYRHGNFGFRLLGPLRKLMPSPLQTNWRIHVKDPRTQIEGIYFVSNAIDATAPALGARLFTEGMPMHVFGRTTFVRDPTTGRVVFELSAGDGSAPDAKGSLMPCDAPVLDDEWRACFDSFQGFLEYAVPQNRAMSGQAWHRRVTRHEIDLPIDLSKCEPLTGTVESSAVEAIVGNAKPVCFRVARLHFTFSEELHDAVDDVEDVRS